MGLTGKLSLGAALPALAVYLAAFAAVALGQRSFEYLPSGEPQAPQALGIARAEVLTLTTSDAERLRAWYVPPAEGRPLLLYLHGNGGSLETRARRFQLMTATGDGLLAVEYRGYPGSTGQYTEAGLHRDADALYARARELGFAPGQIVIVGESLGTGAAVQLAARVPCAALVLDSGFSSAVDVAAGQFWMFPVRLVMQDQFRSIDYIGAVKAPLLMVHGEADTVVPIAFGEKLLAAAPGAKKMIRLPGAGHLAMGTVIPDVLAWIDGAVPGG